MNPKTPTVIHFYSGTELLKEFEMCRAMGKVVSEKSIPSWVSLLYSKMVVLNFSKEKAFHVLGQMGQRSKPREDRTELLGYQNLLIAYICR